MVRSHLHSVASTKSFISGGFGGFCCALMGYPFDTVKVRLQLMPVPPPGHRPLYTGAWDCVRKTVKHEGVKGLYKGLAAPLAGTPIIFACGYWSYRQGTILFEVDRKEELDLVRIFFSGSFAGVFVSFAVVPMERIKVLLQNQRGKTPPKYKGPVDVIKKLFREGGVRSLFRGTVATILKELPACGMYFMTYEWFKASLKPLGGDDNFMRAVKSIVAGGMAGIAYWPLGMPADAIKSHLQSAPEGKYSGIRQALSVLLKEGGPAALYRGMVPVMLMAFPANAACFAGVEACTLVLSIVVPNL